MSQTLSPAAPAGSVTPEAAGQPANARTVLTSLILVAAVANLNLSVANVALPDIGKSFDSSQTTLDLIAVGYSLGLAASVLWFGALGDRYGRKLMIVLGMLLSIPASLVAGFAPSDTTLFFARVVGGLAAGMAYPTTLALITALWSGPARTRSIALWSALGGGIAALGPLVSGLLLEHFVWGSVFLVTLPLAVLALFMAQRYVPAHINESTERVDNLGGGLSALAIGTLVVGLNFITAPNLQSLAVGLFVIAGIGLILFVIRQRRAPNPLYDLKVAARPTFWVAAIAGIIVFGSLMGIAFVNQQYLQNVQGYSSLQAGAAILPAVFFMVVVAPRSAALVQQRGSRFTLLVGQSMLALAFIAMLALWGEDSPYWQVAVPLALMGIGVGLAGHAVVELAHRLGAGAPRWHGIWHGRPAARPGRCVDDLDLWRPAHGRVRIGNGHRDLSVRAGHHGHHAERAAAVLFECRGPGQPIPAVLNADHLGRQGVVPPG